MIMYFVSDFQQQGIIIRYRIENMYKSSPAFSIKGKYNKVDRQVKPSPLAYHVEQWNPKKTPSWKIGTDAKCKINISKNPGPGAYQTSPSTKQNKFGIIGKQNGRAERKSQKSPSPVSYSPKLAPNTTSISFAKKYQIINKDINNPGPGAYQRQRSIKTQNYVIGKDQRFKQDIQPKLVPGPGTYELKRPSSAKISFGKQKRQCSKKLHTSVDPGPGQYERKNIFQQSTASCKGYSLGVKTVVKDLQTRPGPGNYDPNFNAMYYSNPSFSMPRKYKVNKPEPNPAPNQVTKNFIYFQYQPKNCFQSVHISFNKSKRKPFINNKDIPGPGEYQPSKAFKSSPKFSLGMSRKTEIKQDFPGPGSYQPNKNVIKSRPQSAKIGTSMRNNERKQKSPGPGQYGSINRERPSTPSYAFTKDSRMKQRIITSPGPGQYQTLSSVAYTAPYALK